MTQKKIKHLVLAVLAVVLIIYQFFVNDPNSADKEEIKTELLKHPIVPTKHGQCRMDCREITMAEVSQILSEGEINWQKSDVNDKPCPSYAIEGITQDQQYVRIVLAACKDQTKVITAIDLERKYNCACN